ncbi:MAG: selenium metabolism-associated LysR family transcriptional regulator [Thermodesulfobacteriota bacterium]
MDFRDLESLIKVADLRSFSKAAEALYLTQPTISGHIQALEQELGIRLMDRAKAGVTLTQAGQIIYDYAKRLLDVRKEAKEAIDAFTGLIRGSITIGGSTIPGEFILPALVGRFKKDYPGISVSLKVGDTLTICNQVLTGEVELAVVGAKLFENRINYLKHYKDEIALVAAAEHPLAKKGRIGLGQLPQCDMILREEGSATRLMVEKKLADRKLSWASLNIVAVLGSTAAVKEGMLAGVGLSFISRRAVKNELALGLMKEIEVGGLGELKRPFYIALNRQKALSPAGKILLETILKDKA